MLRRSLLTVLATALVLAAQSTPESARLNQIQVIGSHNSYKEAIDRSLWMLLRAEDAGRLLALDYSHVSLTRQLDEFGLRNLELDVVYDPAGGRYAQPYGLAMVAEASLPPGEPYDPGGLMRQPGFKVLHMQDIDFRTSVLTFKQALQELKAWSDRHPGHLPIAVTMNAKDGTPENPDFTPALPFDATAFDAWDKEIRAVLPAGKLITPDDVRGPYPTLEAAVLAHAWPTLAESRGKFLFVLDETGEKLETYTQGHPGLHGRVMFINASEDRPEAAFLIVNDPEKEFRRIQHLVRSGYLVRTRADAETREARNGDYHRMRTAFASGAHFITTDYYQANPKFRTGYRVSLPGNTSARWNPLLLPAMRPLPPLRR
jgi:hypothetical protein